MNVRERGWAERDLKEKGFWKDGIKGKLSWSLKEKRLRKEGVTRLILYLKFTKKEVLPFKKLEKIFEK